MTFKSIFCFICYARQTLTVIILVLISITNTGFMHIPQMPVSDANNIETNQNNNFNSLTLPEENTSMVAVDYSENGWLNVQEMGASGSLFETTAIVTSGSDEIKVADIGDFQVGQQIIVSEANIHYVRPQLWGPGEPYSTCKDLDNAVEIRGYDGSAGSWVAYILEIDGTDPLTFRWKGDISKPWDVSRVPVTFDWQKLSGGIEIRFKQQEWKPGHMITFAARDQLVTTIQKIDGNVITVTDSPNNNADGAIVRHTDRDALQKAIDFALKERLNIFFPPGHYRVPGGLNIIDAIAVRIEGANAETTVLDISDGDGFCFRLQGGTEVTIRNFSMTGHTSLAKAPLSFNTINGYGFWPNSLKGCSAVGMSGTERVLIENVHVSRMSCEAFYAQGPAREGKKEPAHYQKSLTYLRCSVTDCAANAFNNNDRAENTSILYCRVDGAGWHAAEMPARFLKVIGCYFRNTGPITVGDMSHRFEDLNELGCGQAFICNNVFEGVASCQGISVNVGSHDIEGIGLCGGIAVTHGSSQVVISGNVFVNFNGNAITASSQTVRPSLPWYKPDAPIDWGSYPSRSIIISENIIDMTCTGNTPAKRIGIDVSTSEVTIADNQVYVRGRIDTLVTGIQLCDPALKLTVHDNQISNCGKGIITKRVSSRILQVEDSSTFYESSLPLEWRYTHQYQGWNLLWTKDGKVTGTSVIDSYDPSMLTFKLRQPYDMKVGDTFDVHYPGATNWSIHNNTITGCKMPVILNNYGSETNRFYLNLIDRGGAQGVKSAITVGGVYQLIDNQITGFNEPSSCGLLLLPDKQGYLLPNIYHGNFFLHCTVGVREVKSGSWKAATREYNRFIDCEVKLGK